MPDIASTIGANAGHESYGDGTVFPKPGHRQVDRPRVHRGDVGVAEPELGHRAGLRVLGDHVEPRREPQHEVAPGRGLEVDGDRPLAEVVAQEGGADARALGVDHRRLRAAPEVAALRVLDLHDVGAEPGEQLGGVGERLHLLEGEHADAVERLARPPPRRRWRRLRGAWTDRTRECDDPSDSLVPLAAWQPGASSARPRTCPHRRLDRSTIAAVAGGGGGKGTRTVAGYDEDTTTMGVEAARAVRRALARTSTPHTLWFSTVAPAYADKTNATAIHAALRLGPDVGAFDANGSVRSSVGALHAGAERSGHPPRGQRRPAQRPARRSRRGRPSATAPPPCSSPTRATRPLLAELIGGGRATEEFLDRWRTPGDARSKVWEERFGETRYVPLGAGGVGGRPEDGRAGGRPGRPRRHRRHARPRRRGAGQEAAASATGWSAPTWPARVGNLGAAQPAVLLTAALERGRRPARSSRSWCWPTVPTSLLFRTTDALAAWTPGAAGRRRRPPAARRSTTAPTCAGAACSRSSRRAAPSRPARRRRRPAARATGSSASSAPPDDDGEVHLPPQPADATDVPMSDATGTIATFTVDRLAYSPSPPVVFAVVDFDGGGRLPVELTDVDVDAGAHRRPGRADVPQAVHRRRHPQLLLEGTAASDG